MNTNRINHSSESDDTKTGGAEMFLLFLYENRTASGDRRLFLVILTDNGSEFRITKCEIRL